MKKNKKNCPCCFGKGKIKDIETKIKIGPFHLGKEYLKPCSLCNSPMFEGMDDKDIPPFLRRTLH